MEMIQTRWFLHDLVRRGHGILGVRAPVIIQYSKNLIAHPEVLDLRFLHDSRNIAPENCRKLRPKTVGSRSNLAIDRIDPGRMHTDQDLIACRFGLRRLLIAKHRRPAKLMYSGRFHSMTILPFRAAAIRNGSGGRRLSKPARQSKCRIRQRFCNPRNFDGLRQPANLAPPVTLNVPIPPEGIVLMTFYVIYPVAPSTIVFSYLHEHAHHTGIVPDFLEFCR